MATIEVEQTTHNLNPAQRFSELRRTYLGGADTFQLFNLPQYGKGCHTALAYEKLGIEPDFPDDNREDALLERGHILEPLVAMLYEEKTKRKVKRPPMDADGVPKPKLHPQYPWAGVNTDRLILIGSGGVTTTGDLEIKTRSEGPFLRVMREGAFYGDELQLQWSTWVNGHTWGSLATLGVFGALPMISVDRPRDEEIVEMFKREGETFANTVWGHGRLPEPEIEKDDQRCKVCQWRMSCRGESIDRAEAAALREVKKAKKDLVQINDPALRHTLSEIDLLKTERDVLKASIEEKSAEALKLVGEQKAILLRGYGKVYQMQWHGSGIDTDALKRDGLYDKYFVEKTGANYLRTYPEKIA